MNELLKDKTVDMYALGVELVFSAIAERPYGAVVREIETPIRDVVGHFQDYVEGRIDE